jgi:hypothetical protein
MFRHSLCTALLLAVAGNVAAESFTYRGQLIEDGQPANGRYALQLHFAADRDGKRSLLSPSSYPRSWSITANSPPPWTCRISVWPVLG